MYFVAPGTVDHFVPIAADRNLAYEWKNYRLASAIANSYKGNSTDVLDPFQVESGWFCIDFPSCLVKPGPGLEQLREAEVLRSIEILRLNTAEQLVQERCDIAMGIVEGELSLNFVQKRYPFLGAEIERFGGTDALAAVMKKRPAS